MAGPLSSEEIEDVVSSVRRLVSNEQRPRTLSRDLNSERLLLTPALRVVPEASPLATLVLDASLRDAMPEAVVAAAPAALAESHPEVAPETVAEAETTAVLDDVLAGDSPIEPGDAAADQTTAEAQLPFVEVEEPAEAAWEDEIWAAPGTISLGEVALAAEEAEVLTGPIPEDAAPDADDLAEPWAQGGSEWAEDAPVPFVPLRRRAEHLAARLNTGEDVDSAQAETDAPVTDAGLAPDPALPTAEAPGTETGADHFATEFLDADGTPLAVLDEAALQDIVRQTIRAELQGDLGERITRNVRKLVRAEINRALMARDLD